MNTNLERTEKGATLFISLIALTLGFSLVLWIAEISLRNFRTTDRHLIQEEAFFAAQGAADAIVADFNQGFKQAKSAALPADLDFITWLESGSWSGLAQAVKPVTDTDEIKTSIFVPTWEGRAFNGATINRARVTRTTTGTFAKGYLVTLRVEVEATSSLSTSPNDLITVTRLFSATNAAEFGGAEFALLTENISCTFCHLNVSTLPLKKNLEEPEVLMLEDKDTKVKEEHYRRALVGTTKYLNVRFDGADTEIHGTLYVGKGVTVADHGKASSLQAFADKDTELRMAELFPGDVQESNNVKRATFKSNGKGKAKLKKAKISASNTEQGQPLYDQYPFEGDYKMDKQFPSPFPDVGDQDGNGAKNRIIDSAELEAERTSSTGKLTVKHYQKIAYNSDEKFANKEYSYSDNKLPTPLTGDLPIDIVTGEKNNLILIGTKENPIKIDGQVMIEGDVVIKGYITGKGMLKATGNIYMPSDVLYNNSNVGTPGEIFAKDNTVGYAAGGSIIIGDYISKVLGSNADFDNGKVEPGTPEGNTGFVTYAAEQIAIYNREELTRTLRDVPDKDNTSLTVGSDFNKPNPMYDPTYTPRYYTMYPNTPAYAFIKDGGQGARFDLTTKTWITPEAPTSFSSHQMLISDIPASVKSPLVTPKKMSLHPNWISPENMLQLIASEEAKRIQEFDGKPFRIDGLLYTNNAIISIQRRRSQTMKNDGTWEEHESSHRGKMEINGSIIAPDLGVLVTNGFNINYDRRVKSLLNVKAKSPVWESKVNGFSRFNGPIVP